MFLLGTLCASCGGMEMDLGMEAGMAVTAQVVPAGVCGSR